MTSVVGILCKDGVVVGTDSSATFDNGQIRTIEQPFEKIEIMPYAFFPLYNLELP